MRNIEVMFDELHEDYPDYHVLFDYLEQFIEIYYEESGTLPPVDVYIKEVHSWLENNQSINN